MRKIDIIIPVYKPDQKFLALVDKLEHQTVAVNKIIIMNTERQYFDRLVKGTSFFEKYQNVCVINLKKEDFDHGLTRRQGVEQSDAQVFVMMTMDAMPVDGDLVEKLTAPLEKGDVAVSYGRQMAGKMSRQLMQSSLRVPIAAKLSGLRENLIIPERGVKNRQRMWKNWE